MTVTKNYGQHYLVDFFGCDPETLRFVAPTREIFMHAARESRATVVGDDFFQFEPEGVSGVVLIAESHFSVHTWPEEAFAAVDIFTCGEEMDPQIAVDILSEAFRAERTVTKIVDRGSMEAGFRERGPSSGDAAGDTGD